MCRNPPSGLTDSIAWAVAKTDDLFLTAQASKIPASATILYSWTLRLMYSNTLGPILSISVLSFYTEGGTTSTLKVKKDFFKIDESAIGCMICANADYAGNVGSSCLRFVYLEAPTQGTCQFQLGNVASYGCITCTNYSSNYGDLKYQFWLNLNPRSTIAADSDSSVCVTLPVTKGPVNLCVTVSDTYGNEVRNCFAKINVPPPPKESILSSAKNLIENGNTALQNVTLTGTPLAKASAVALVTSTVKEWKNIVTEGTFANLLVNKTAEEQERNQRAEVLSQAVGVVTTMVPTNADSALLSVTAIQSVLEIGTDVDRKSQVLLSKAMSDMSDGLKDLLSAENSEKQRDVADQVLHTVVNLMQTMNSQINDAVPKDVVHDKTKLNYDVDLESEGLSCTGDDVWDELSLKNAATDQSSTTKDFTPPSFTSVDPTTNRSQLPPSRIAADNSEVYQALLMSEITTPDDNCGLSFQLEPEDTQACPQYLVVVRLVYPPVLTQKTGTYDFYQAVPINTDQCLNNTMDPDQEGYPYTFFLNNKQLIEARRKALNNSAAATLSPEEKSRIYIGYRQLNPSELNQYGEDKPPPIPYPYRDQINNTALSRIYLSTCVSTNTENPRTWSPDGCVVGPRTTTMRTHCLCSHLSTFASGWLELPNAIDFDYVFANMDFTKNPTLYATEIAILAIFILLFIWARRRDLKDVEKLGVTPLAENNPKDEYLYELIVSTGRRTGSGTDSK
ncbi:unnamed protein product, partial [Echinostoma caproni]